MPVESKPLFHPEVIRQELLTHLVNQAYALTPEETALLWSTAPPRMPVPKPPQNPEFA